MKKDKQIPFISALFLTPVRASKPEAEKEEKEDCSVICYSKSPRNKGEKMFEPPYPSPHKYCEISQIRQFGKNS